jgi:hypothetical protein
MISHTKTLFKIGPLSLERRREYTFIVEHGVRPKDYKEKTHKVEFKLRWK